MRCLISFIQCHKLIVVLLLSCLSSSWFGDISFFFVSAFPLCISPMMYQELKRLFLNLSSHADSTQIKYFKSGVFFS